MEEEKGVLWSIPNSWFLFPGPPAFAKAEGLPLVTEQVLGTPKVYQQLKGTQLARDYV